MGRYYREYNVSTLLENEAYKYGCNAFYALLMAAMRTADTDNLEVLENVFSDVVAELRQRYNAPGGLLEGER